MSTLILVFIIVNLSMWGIGLLTEKLFGLPIENVMISILIGAISAIISLIIVSGL